MNKELNQVVILFAGDSGDGMQLTGSQFTNTSAHMGNDVSTFPDFPAEIRAPAGTVAGVSGFQLHFGSVDITSPGDYFDVMVAMNAAALIKNISRLKENGILIVNESGFDGKNLRLAKLDENPLDKAKEKFQLYSIDISGQTSEALKNFDLGTKDKDRTKNMFALGFVYWLYNRPLDYTLQFLKTKFAQKPEILEANEKVLKAGYHYGEITDTFTERFVVKPAKVAPGKYRNITGNQALSLGLIAAANKAGLDLFYGGYPITPASDILHFLSAYKNFGIKTFQAEDEIAAMAAVVGAAFAGDLAVTASSGPGIALKAEAMGLALMLELPAVIINVQRGGPSTGLPTKTEQADLLQALYGRNGEAPVVVVAAHSPSHCFEMAFKASKIALEHMTPVILLSDGYLGNGSEPWLFPRAESLEKIKIQNQNIHLNHEGQFLPYEKDERGVRKWATPGMKDFEHRIGGLEKQRLTGNVSYNPENHQFMVQERAAKIEKIADFLPPAELNSGSLNSEVLIVSWGGTYGSVKAGIRMLEAQQIQIAHLHLDYINPLQHGVGEILNQFKHILVPELNHGQLIKILREKFLVDAIGLNKIQGVPFTANEIADRVMDLLK
ncbi:2-oxoglutarate ferredoxin oxidoreductase subunit alpha [Candidatus Ornithobacterium hominis]|uniref:2-oxoglutarate ferredoxin oxidoreductase subunit alpha n=1 Tax=Candidatus Ornithobacterium hominis TaxID=2497989 RepID=A0A383TUP8_9FLAO|nr:2-oxoacid:acceptor oxidoreductase subunit alpha [Candidatus Ornithobacterium hominis]MCT7904467.1 2-oxoacid:acceptor oxidoreductase subunit alpha [Candidatus Ornithobacterium hominis]SZD71364.1 2-oxoglutarate ferredoxin oxidoreductase subunit alpha [Candidatus Ornithobacterium hominis]